MGLKETVFGIVGMVLFAGSAYYCRRILAELADNQETELAKFFLRDPVARAFKALAITAFLFSLGMLLAGIALVIEHPVLDYASKIGGLTMFIGFLYFFRTVATATIDR